MIEVPKTNKSGLTIGRQHVVFVCKKCGVQHNRSIDPADIKEAKCKCGGDMVPIMINGRPL